MQSKAIIDVLNNVKATSFIHQHMNGDVSKLALQFAGKVDFNLTEVLKLIKIYGKARVKLPLFVEHQLAIDARSYEQSTAQSIASYKSTQIGGNSLLDMTGGIGVDSLFLAKSFKTVDVYEQNRDLHLLAEYNIDKLEIKNINRVNAASETALNKRYDWIYLDPDRRVKFTKAVALEDMEPNIIDLLPNLRKQCRQVYIKLSPLFDLDEIWKVFSDVREVLVLAEKGEVKEVGVILSWGLNNRLVKLHDVSSRFHREYNLSEEIPSVPTCVNRPIVWKYLHLANSLLTKSRTEKYQLTKKIVEKHEDFNLYFSNEKSIDGFRTFRVEEIMPAGLKSIKKVLKKHNIAKLNIIVKGSKETPLSWHKKLKTSDGGFYYLFILLGSRKEAMICSFSSFSEQ